MDFKRNALHGKLRKIHDETAKKAGRFMAVNKAGILLLGGVSALMLVTGIWFGTAYLSDPDVDETALLDASPYVRKHVVVNEDSAHGFLDDSQQENDTGSAGGVGSKTYGGWDNLSGYYWGKYPLELYPLSTMCERGCSEKSIHQCVGDYGQAYGLMQLDYRYDLVPFMQTAYQQDPVAWKGFEPFQEFQPGNGALVNNQGIIDAFNYCYDNYPNKYMEIQPNFMVEEYLFCDEVQNILDANNFKLEDHSIYVAAALMSCNINCGYVTGTKNFFKAGANNNMSDEELLNCVYTGWRMYRSASKWAQHNARLAIDKSGEEGVALQFLHGEIDITTFDNSKTCAFGAGWDGPNAVRISSRGS